MGRDNALLLPQSATPDNASRGAPHTHTHTHTYTHTYTHIHTRTPRTKLPSRAQARTHDTRTHTTHTHQHTYAHMRKRTHRRPFTHARNSDLVHTRIHLTRPESPQHAAPLCTHAHAWSEPHTHTRTHKIRSVPLVLVNLRAAEGIN